MPRVAKQQPPGEGLRRHLTTWQHILADSGAVARAVDAVQATAADGSRDGELSALTTGLTLEADWVLSHSRSVLFATRLRREIAARLSRRLSDRTDLAVLLTALEETPIDQMLDAYSEEVMADIADNVPTTRTGTPANVPTP